MVDAKGIAERVRSSRKKRNLTQAQLAELAGVSDETISRIERAAFEPSISTLVQIADALEHDVSALVGHGADALARTTPVHSAVLRRLADRAALLDLAAQKALLRVAELLPAAAPTKGPRRKSGKK